MLVLFDVSPGAHKRFFRARCQNLAPAARAQVSWPVRAIPPIRSPGCAPLIKPAAALTESAVSSLMRRPLLLRRAAANFSRR